MAEGSKGTISGADKVWVKLALAAVEATDCAMEGTVNCASREEGRPALTGTDVAAVGTGAATCGLANTIVGTILTGATGTAALDLGAITLGFLDFATVAFTKFFTLTLVVGLTALTGAVLTTLATVLEISFNFLSRTLGLTDALTDKAFLTGALDAVPRVDLVTDFVSDLVTRLTGGLAIGLATGLALTADFALGLATVLVEAFTPCFALTGAWAALDIILTFPVCAFTSFFLAECTFACARLADIRLVFDELELIPSIRAGADLFCCTLLAREFTGLATGKPISCKIETNICFPPQG